MTREEAIEKLNNAKGCPLLYDSHIEAIDMAIYALEQEPLKNIREEIASHIGGCGFLNDGLDVALRIIDKHIGRK